MSLPTRRWSLFVALLLISLAALVTACQAAATPAPATPPPVERIVTQVVEKSVQKAVQETVVVEKVVEKAVVVTPVPQPTAPGSDLAADQTLRYVTRGFQRLDPALEAGFGTVVISHIWMPLFIRDIKHNISNWLASGYEANADNTVYTVHINPKAVWSDGSPVLAQEAKDYWIYGLHPDDCKACYLNQLDGWEVIKGAKDVMDGKSRELAGIVVKDDKTLEFDLVNPDPIFIHRLALWNTGFAKMEDVKKGPEYASDGTARVNGPFMVKIWNVDKKQYEVVQNPKWWGDKKPIITRIILTEAADENVSFIQWQNNEVDLALWLTNIKERLRKDQPGTFNLMPQPTNLFFYQWINKAPLDDINVRKALVHAVDWDKAINAAWEGSRNDRIMKTVLTPELPCYKPNNWPEWGYDPAKAKTELAASKYATPDKLGKIRITPQGSSPNYLRTAEIMAEQWKNNLGITDVEIKSGRLDAWGQDQDLVQVRRASLGALIPDPGAFLASHYTIASNPTGMALKDDKLSKMLSDLNLAKRTDPNYCTMVQAAEAEFLSNYIFLPMILEPYETNVKPWVKNFSSNIDLNWSGLMDMYIAKH